MTTCVVQNRTDHRKMFTLCCYYSSDLPANCGPFLIFFFVFVCLFFSLCKSPLPCFFWFASRYGLKYSGLRSSSFISWKNKSSIFNESSSTTWSIFFVKLMHQLKSGLQSLTPFNIRYEISGKCKIKSPMRQVFSSTNANASAIPWSSGNSSWGR